MTRRRLLLTLAGLVLGAAAGWFALRDLRVRDLLEVLIAIGPAVGLVLVPQSAAMLLDTAAWQRLLARLGSVTAFRPLWRARVASEFMAIALPAGALVADGTLSVVLTRWCGIAPPEAVAGVTARKLMIWRAHAMALVMALVLAASGAGSARLRRAPVLWTLAVATVVLVLVAVGLEVLAGSAQPAARLRTLLLRLPFARLRSWLETAEARFHSTDARLAEAARTRPAALMVVYSIAWLARAAEPWVILRLAGARLSYAEVLAAEAVVGLVRSAAVVVPAGLGVQELGYATFLRLSGAADPAALTAALALLRRAREAMWALAGYALLLRPSSAAARATP